MAERFIPSQQPELKFPSEKPLIEQGRHDFSQALDFLSVGNDHRWDADADTHFGIASDMISVGLSPQKVLDILHEQRDTNSLLFNASATEVEADILGLTGHDDEMRTKREEALKDHYAAGHRSYYSLTPYYYAIRGRVERGEDPQPLVDEVTEYIDSLQPKPYDKELGGNKKAKFFGELADALIQAGMDEKPILDREREEREKIPGSPSYPTRRTVLAYSSAGRFNDAVGLLNSTIQTAGEREYFAWGIIEDLISSGDYDSALTLARRYNNKAAPVVEARKLLFETQEGDNVSSEANGIQQHEMADWNREKISTILGEAYAKAGSTEEAAQMFDRVEDSFETDDQFAGKLYFDLAAARHRTDINKKDAFRVALDFFKVWKKDESIAFLQEFKHMEKALAHGVRNMIDCKEYDLARSTIGDAEYDNEWKAELMSDLAKQEITDAQKAA